MKKAASHAGLAIKEFAKVFLAKKYLAVFRKKTPKAQLILDPASDICKHNLSPVGRERFEKSKKASKKASKRKHGRACNVPGKRRTLRA